MMIFKYFFLFSLLSTLSACSFFAKKMGLPNTNEDVRFHINNAGPLYCKKKLPFQIVGNNAQNNERMENFIKVIGPEYKLSFIEKAVIIHLLQMLARPDLTSPQAKLDFYYQKGKKIYYQSFSSDSSAPSFLEGLSKILKDFNSKRNLKELMQIIDTRFHTDMIVDEDFAIFLQKNKEWIASSEFTQKLYLRAEETLKMGETLPRQKLTTLYQKNLFQTDKKTENKNYLYSFYDKNKNEFKCNYDMNHYDQSLFLISDYFVRANIFGLYENGEFFLSSASLKVKEQSLDNTIFFQGSSKTRSAAICISDKMGLISSDSRDPGQHLYHLIEYDVGMVRNNSELNSMVAFSRHLFLTNPLRLIYESSRGTKEQLSELLELNVPLYNADSLARVWGWYQDATHPFSFQLDARRTGAISCPR